MIGMWESSEPGLIYDGLRSCFSVFDGIGATLLGVVYKVFYVVANATIIKGDVIKVFYSRIQLIIGILMIFKLSLSILNIIINPDLVKDQKNGPGKMVTRIVTALFMLTLVIPINIPDATSNSLNAYINDHGIFFGVLYKAQDAILSENILAKLILGTTAGGISTDEDDDTNGMNVNNLSDVGNAMASTVLRVFVRINVKDDTAPPCEDSETCENTICPGEVYESHYAEDNVDPHVILNHINDSCGSGSSERYAFGYTPFVGSIVMIVMTIIIIGFTLDVAVRAIKLAVLRLVAPVPIISYINPPKQGGGAFDNWTKTLMSTYIDLFVRLAIIYFGLFLIQILMEGGLDILGSNAKGFSFTYGVAYIFILLGVLVFMKQAPQFLKDILGIKGKPMGNVGLSSLLGGTAMAIGGGGLAGFGLGAMQGFDTANRAAAEGKPSYPFQSWAQNRDQMAKIRTGDKDARGGILGGLMDRSLYYARERQLGIKGLSSNNSTLAKAASKKQAEVVDAAQIRRDLAYEKVKKAGLTGKPAVSSYAEAATDLNNYITYGQSQGWSQSTIENSNTYKQLSSNASNARIWEEFDKADKILKTEQDKAESMQKNAKAISDARSATGVDTRLIDEYGGSGIGGTRLGTYRAGAKRTRFDPYSSGEPANLDDINWRGPSIGGSPGTGSGGPPPGGPRP